jgi:glycosyltransferase involved in cell wall biosynthesis
MSAPNTEIVIPDISGIYVPPRQPDALAQAMLRLHNNPDERKRMGAAARQIAIEKFSSQQNSKRVLDVYRRLTLDKSAPLCVNMDESAS